jgi:hydroxymethylpyrimidine kinase/phosphomethylpyrimidine kinase
MASAETIRLVAAALRRHNVTTTVIDPVLVPLPLRRSQTQFSQVMVSTSGSQLLPQAAVAELLKQLLPITTVLTPNIPEAKMLLLESGQTFKDPQCIEDLIDVAKQVQSLGPKWVLVKGGHLPFKKDGTIAATEEEKDIMVDILYGNGEVFRVEGRYQHSKNTHGTGCSLACKLQISKKIHSRN